MPNLGDDNLVLYNPFPRKVWIKKDFFKWIIKSVQFFVQFFSFSFSVKVLGTYKHVHMHALSKVYSRN